MHESYTIICSIYMGVGFFLTSFANLTGTPISGALLGDNRNATWFKPIIFSGVTILAGTVAMVICRQLVVKRRGTPIVWVCSHFQLRNEKTVRLLGLPHFYLRKSCTALPKLLWLFNKLVSYSLCFPLIFQYKLLHCDATNYDLDKVHDTAKNNYFQHPQTSQYRATCHNREKFDR